MMSKLDFKKATGQLFRTPAALPVTRGAEPPGDAIYILPSDFRSPDLDRLLPDQVRIPAAGPELATWLKDLSAAYEEKRTAVWRVPPEVLALLLAGARPVFAVRDAALVDPAWLSEISRLHLPTRDAETIVAEIALASRRAQAQADYARETELPTDVAQALEATNEGLAEEGDEEGLIDE